MDEASWPTDRRQLRKDGQTKGKGKAKAVKTIRDYPYLDYGLLNALTLSPDNGRLKWSTITGTTKGKKLERGGDPVKIFPATRPSPLQMPKASVSQRAEQGANFLRTYFPDIEIPAELIRDEISADTHVSCQLEKYDPYAGNLLEAIQCPSGLVSQTAFLCFPMGESNQDLNVSPFASSKMGDIVLKPAAFPSQTFETPIQQIVSSSSENRKQASYLAVRTHASTSLFEVKAMSERSASEVQLTEKVIIGSSDTGGRPIVDIKIAPSPTAGIIVNDHGAVYRCDFGNGCKSLRLLHTTTGISTRPNDFFWRLSLIDHFDGCILASDKRIVRLDWRTSHNHVDLFSFHNSGNIITSIDGPQTDNLMRLCSTKEVLWVDNRFTRSPLLGYKHGRSFDRTLETRTILQPTPLTFLMSRRNGLVTVYDVSRSNDGLIHANVPPYSLPAVSEYEARITGHLLFRHPSNPNNAMTSIYQLNDRGSIHRLDLGFPPINQIKTEGVRSWSTDLQKLAETSSVYPDMGPLASQVATEVDLRPAYQRIFNLDSNSLTADGEQRESIQKPLESMASYWQNSPLPEHMLTMFDIAFRSNNEPLEASRADFLTQSKINREEGYRALVQDRIPRQTLVHDAPWHNNLTPVLSKLDSEFPEDLYTFIDRLRQYDLISEAATPLRIESDAREQLALDLVLSKDIFAPQPCVRAVQDNLDVLETMSRAAEAMSLDDEPPPVSLGYLRPKARGVTESRSTMPSRTTPPISQEFDCPLGVRLLLKDWEVGTDPSEYSYDDPYDESYSDVAPIRRTRNVESSTQGTQSTMPTQSQRPPLVIASKPSTLPIVNLAEVAIHERFGIRPQSSTRPPVFRTGSQIMANDATIGASSQDAMGSTQILPGPYGGRQPMKKPAKKRMGGF